MEIDGIGKGSIESAIKRNELDSKLSKGQQDIKKNALWDTFTSNAETKDLLKSIKSIDDSTKVIKQAADFTIKDSKLSKKYGPTLSDMASLSAPHSYGFLYLANILEGHESKRDKRAARKEEKPEPKGGFVQSILRGGVAMGGLAGLAMLAVPSIRGVLFGGMKTDDPEVAAIRNAYLKTHAESIYAHKEDIIKGAGGRVVAWGAVIGDAIGAAFEGLATSAMNIKDIITDEELNETRRKYFLEQQETLYKSTSDLYKEHASTVAWGDLLGKTVGKAVGSAFEGLAESAMNIVLLATDPDFTSQRKIYLLNQQKALYDATSKAYEDNIGIIAGASAGGRLVGEAIGGILGGIAETALDFTLYATDEDLLKRRKDYLHQQLDTIYGIRLARLGTPERPRGAAIAISIGAETGKTIGSIIGGALESIAQAGLDITLLATDKDLIDMRREFLKSQLESIYSVRLSYYGDNEPDDGFVGNRRTKKVGIGSYILTGITAFGEGIGSLFGGFVSGLSEAALDTALLATDPELVGLRRDFFRQQLTDLYDKAPRQLETSLIRFTQRDISKREDLFKDFYAELGEQGLKKSAIKDSKTLVEGRDKFISKSLEKIYEQITFAGVELQPPKATWKANDNLSKMLEHSLDFSSKELSPVREAAATKYAESLSSATIPPTVLTTNLSSAINTSLLSSVEKMVIEWSDASYKTREEAASTYIKAIASFFERQMLSLDMEATPEQKESLLGRVLVSPRLDIQNLTHKIVSDTAELNTSSFTIDNAQLQANNLTVEIPYADEELLVLHGIARINTDMLQNLQTIASLLATQKPPVVEVTPIEAPQESVIQRLVRGTP